MKDTRFLLVFFSSLFSNLVLSVSSIRSLNRFVLHSV